MRSRNSTALESAERALQQQTRRLETLNRIALAISSNLDLEQIVQRVTDAATEVTGAKFGAFFYNVIDAQGERFTLFTLSGAPRESFETLGLPRNTAVFDSTFRGQEVIRSDDIRADRRYGKNAPHYGMPKGHLPVVSYLAVPVISRSGEVHGGLFFGHDEPAVFTAEHEELVAAIAAHAAVAIDNSRLLEAAQSEVEKRRQSELAAQRLAAIVESSDDAILSKDLDGIIETWNRGAERLYGYTAAEVIGKSVTVLFPEDRQGELPEILARIRRGDRVDHYETVRKRKDGSLLDVSLTVSPVRNSEGEIIGASKIARDITGRKQAEERQRLLLMELRHRVKNAFALCGSLVALSARSAETPRDLASAVQERLAALDRAHTLTLPKMSDGGDQAELSATLHALIRAIASPYEVLGDGDRARVTVTGFDARISRGSVTGLALLLHEFATNAAKYGALSNHTGHIEIECSEENEQIVLIWKEHGGPSLGSQPEGEGFGTRMAEATVRMQLNGEISRDWDPEGVCIRVTIPRDRLLPHFDEADPLHLSERRR